jgi:hypothetical protein
MTVENAARTTDDDETGLQVRVAQLRTPLTERSRHSPRQSLAEREQG